MKRQTKKPFMFRRVTSMMIAAVMAATCFTAVPAAAYSVDSFEEQDIVVGTTSAEWDATIAINFDNGTGTKSNPYQIANGQQLAYLAEQVNSGETYEGKYFRLTADILLNDDVNTEPNSWVPIGNSENRKFCGTFDGDNHNVIGVYINDSSNDYRGLFGYIGKGGSVTNVGVTDGLMVCTGEYVGGICGSNKGTISGCYNANKITSSSSSDYYGGVWGDSNSSTSNTMTNCYNAGKVSGTGIEIYPVGKVSGQISNVYNDSDVCSGFDTDNNSWARTTKQLTAATALADLGFDSTIWNKKANTSYHLYYPDLAAFDNDGAYVFIGNEFKPKITGYKVGDYQVKLEWTALEGAEMYRVYTYADGVYTRQFTCDGSRNIATVTGLVNGIEYGFVVSAKVDGTWTPYNVAELILYATPNA